jgi:hypothetical protein
MKWRASCKSGCPFARKDYIEAVRGGRGLVKRSVRKVRKLTIRGKILTLQHVCDKILWRMEAGFFFMPENKMVSQPSETIQIVV